MKFILLFCSIFFLKLLQCSEIKIKTLSSHLNKISDLVLLKYGCIATGSLDSTVKIWNPSSGKLLRTQFYNTSFANNITSLILLNNTYLAQGTLNGQIKLFDPITSRLYKVINTGPSAIKKLVQLSESKIATLSNSDSFDVWNLRDGLYIKSLIFSQTIIQTFLLDNNFIACSVYYGFKYGIILKSFMDKNFIKILVDHDNVVNSIAVIDDVYLATGSSDKTIKIWDWSTQELIKTLTGHNASVNKLVLLNNGYLASSSNDSTIKIWNPLTGDLISTLEGHNGTILDLIYFNQTYLISSSNDQTIKIWNTEKAELVMNIEGNFSLIDRLYDLNNGLLAGIHNFDFSVKIFDLNSLLYKNIFSTIFHKIWDFFYSNLKFLFFM